MSARDELFRRVAGAFIDEAKANGLLEAYRTEVVAADRSIHRIQILAEVADLLRDAEETDAALLVDRLLEAGESRG